MDVPIVPQSATPTGGARGVLEASALARDGNEAATLALVVATEGSTYVRAGTLALFGGTAGQVGWLSGGCLEPEIAQHAAQAASQRRLGWLDIDTRDDADLLSGSAVGCRGRLRIALLPLALLPGWSALVTAWLHGTQDLQLDLSTRGELRAAVGEQVRQWTLPIPATATALPESRLRLPSPPTVLVFGAGPESPTLLDGMRRQGWMVTVVEQRPRWRPLALPADEVLACTPQAAMEQLRATRPARAAFDAALVLHHHFELDREALAALAASDITFIGLLGPRRRREDLFRVLTAAQCDALVPRLRSPVGLDLGGQGPEAIALSIVAQLQAHLHAPRPA